MRSEKGQKLGDAPGETKEALLEKYADNLTVLEIKYAVNRC